MSNFIGFGSQFGLGYNLGGSLGTTMGNSASNAASASSAFSNTMSGIGAGVGAAMSIGQLWSGLRAADKADRRAREQLDLSRKQFEAENARYEKREKERLDANQAIADSASSYALPMSRM